MTALDRFLTLEEPSSRWRLSRLWTVRTLMPKALANIGWTHALVDHASYNGFSIVDGCSAILVVVHRGLLLAN